ncbi:MAG: hypothetical protein IMY75_13375 [Chloroflexi bacterium]|nr:hypothetical protein [Chloroflexota bacterium]
MVRLISVKDMDAIQQAEYDEDLLIEITARLVVAMISNPVGFGHLDLAGKTGAAVATAVNVVESVREIAPRLADEATDLNKENQ